MAKRAKRQFHCERCGNPCEIYKKGKKHRVLVCPQCGVLATNPFSFGKSLKGAFRGAVGSIPVVGGAIVGAGEGFEGKKQTATTPSLRLDRHPKNVYSAEERVRDALL